MTNLKLERSINSIQSLIEINSKIKYLKLIRLKNPKARDCNENDEIFQGPLF